MTSGACKSGWFARSGWAAALLHLAATSVREIWPSTVDAPEGLKSVEDQRGRGCDGFCLEIKRSVHSMIQARAGILRERSPMLEISD